MQMFMTEFGQEVMQCIRRGPVRSSCKTENRGTLEYKGVRIKWISMLEASGFDSLSDPRFEANAVIAGCSDNAQSCTKDSAIWSAWKEGGVRFMRCFQSCLVGKKQRSRRVPVKYNFQLILDAAKVIAMENGIS